MPMFLQTRARLKRAEATEMRRVANAISLTAHRALFMDRAADLDQEAEELERKAAEGPQGD